MKFFPVFLALAALLLSACSTTSEYKAVYEGAKIMDPLQVPPDLSQPTDSDSDSLDEITSYSGYEKSLNATEKGQVLRSYQGMHFVRDGSLFWLDVQDSPTHVWQSLHSFFTQLGFKIIFQRPELGLLQTNWKQNRAGIPDNWFMKFIGKLYTADTLDSYRAHLEYDSAHKVTRVFIAHQGVREGSDDQWEKRPANPELEEEMLMRFMAFRGMGDKLARQAIAQTKPVIKATLKQTKDGYVLQYNDGFARVWRLVGIALDRMGVLIEDRNRSAGVYYIQLPDSFQIGEKSGFFASAKKPAKNKYLLSLEDKGDNTLITVKARGEVGKDFTTVSKKILGEVKNNLQ